MTMINFNWTSVTLSPAFEWLVVGRRKKAPGPSAEFRTGHRAGCAITTWFKKRAACEVCKFRDVFTRGAGGDKTGARSRTTGPSINGGYRTKPGQRQDPRPQGVTERPGRSSMILDIGQKLAVVGW